MSPACDGSRFGTDAAAGAEHARLCPECREEARRLVASRARAPARSSAALPPVTPDFLTRCVKAMIRAARDPARQGPSSA